MNRQTLSRIMAALALMVLPLAAGAEERTVTKVFDGLSWDYKGKPLPETYWSPYLPLPVQQIFRFKLGIRVSEGSINVRCPVKVAFTYDTAKLRAGERLQVKVKAEPVGGSPYTFASSFGVYLPNKIQLGFAGISGVPDILPWFDVPMDFWDLVSYIPKVGSSIASLKENIGVNMSSTDALPLGSAKEYHDQRTLASVDLSELVTDKVKGDVSTKLLDKMPASARLTVLNAVKAAKGLDGAGAEKFVKDLIGSGLEKLAGLASLSTKGDPYYKLSGEKLCVMVKYGIPGKLTGTYPVNLDATHREVTLDILMPYFVSPGDQIWFTVESITYDLRLIQGLTAKMQVSLADLDLANTEKVVAYPQVTRAFTEQDFRLALDVSASDKPILGFRVNPAKTAASIRYTSPNVALKGRVEVFKGTTLIRTLDETEFKTNHYLAITGLEGETAYRFALSCVDQSGNVYTDSAEATTKKTATVQRNEPEREGKKIYDWVVTPTSPTSLSFSWKSNANVSTCVFLSVSPEWGTSYGIFKKTGGVAYGDFSTVPGVYVMESSHALVAPNLDPGTTYYYTIRSYVYDKDDPARTFLYSLGVDGIIATPPAPAVPSVRARVTLDGSPVPNLPVYVRRQDGSRPATIVLTGADGQTAPVVLDKSTSYSIGVGGQAVFEESSVPLVTSAQATGEQPVVSIALKRRPSPGGSVIDEKGAPLSGASVQIQSSSYRTTTNAQGRFSFDGLSLRGAQTLVVSRPPEYEQRSAPAAIDALGFFAAPPVVLKSLRTRLSVTVRDDTNKAVAGAPVVVKQGTAVLGTLATDAAGRAVYEHLFAASGSLDFSVEAQPAAATDLLPAAEAVTAEAGTAVSVTLTCQNKNRLVQVAAAPPAGAGDLVNGGFDDKGFTDWSGEYTAAAQLATYLNKKPGGDSIPGWTLGIGIPNANCVFGVEVKAEGANQYVVLAQKSTRNTSGGAWMTLTQDVSFTVTAASKLTLRYNLTQDSGLPGEFPVGLNVYGADNRVYVLLQKGKSTKEAMNQWNAQTVTLAPAVPVGTVVKKVELKAYGWYYTVAFDQLTLTK